MNQYGTPGGILTKHYQLHLCFYEPMAARRSLRLPGYDYKTPGAYFVTIVTHERRSLFGRVADYSVKLSTMGVIAQELWLEIPRHFSRARLDAFVVMPNHVHGLIILTWSPEVGARHAVPPPRAEAFGQPRPGSLPTIIRSYKSAVTRRINLLSQTPGKPVWQRNYWEHVIRNEAALSRIREYIAANPYRWPLDPLNPQR